MRIFSIISFKIVFIFNCWFLAIILFGCYNFIMLKFLENREEDRSPKRSPIKYLP